MTDSLSNYDYLSTCARRVLDQHYGIRTATSLTRVDHSGFSGTYLWNLQTEAGQYALRSYEFLAERLERLRFSHQVVRFVVARNCDRLSAPIVGRNSNDGLIMENSRIWELSHWLPGNSDFEVAPSESKMRSAVQGLARFHEVSREFSSDVGYSEGVRRRGARLRQLDAIVKQADVSVHSFSAGTSALIPAAIRLLAAIRIPSENLQKQASAWEALVVPRLPIFADPWRNNLLFSGEQFVGFVDYSSMRMDSPAVDFVRMVGSLRLNQAIPWHRALEYYREIRPLESGDLGFLGWLHASGLVTAALNWLEWIFVHRREFSSWPAVGERMYSVAKDLEELKQTLESSDSGTEQLIYGVPLRKPKLGLASNEFPESSKHTRPTE